MGDDAAKMYTATAQVACELFRAQEIALALTVVSKNARALAVRAGTTAAGFHEITRFIESLSSLTIAAAGEVNEIAILQTKIATQLYRTESLLNRLLRVTEQKEDKVLAMAIQKAQSNQHQLQREMRKTFRRLRNQLESTKLELRATQVVSVVSRVEASRADAEFQSALNSVADKVASAGDKINQHLRAASQYLAHLSC